MKKITLILILLLVIVFNSCRKEKQDIPETEYYIQVLDSDSNDPIPHAKVNVRNLHLKYDQSFWGTWVDDSLYTRETDQFGIFNFRGPATYYLKLS